MTEVQSSLGAMTTASPAATVRDRAANALVLGIAGSMWFGWSQEGPPASWVPFLIAGSVTGAAVAIAALVLTRRHRAGPSAVRGAGGFTAYLWTAGIEVAAIAVGSAVLGLTGEASYISPWVLFVVGAHFLPLGRLFRIDSLRVCGLLVAAVAVVATCVGLSGVLLPSAVTGAGGGVLMVAFGAYSLRSAWRDRMQERPRGGREAVS